jgi:Do/DeqQ family serine protease
MKRSLPFLITGLLSAGLALGLFALLYEPQVIVQEVSPRSLRTNYSPFEESGTAVPVGMPDMIRASNQAKSAVVYIEAVPESTGYFTRRSQGGSTGSGVIISANGYIATNHHVIEEGGKISIMMDDGREFEAKLIGSDKSTDLALLKVDGDDLPYLTFGDSDSLMVGEWVIAIGNPFRLYSTVTAGIVSAKSRNINILDDSGIESFIQTDAAVNPGNSGGALVNTKGQLMGINTAIMTFSGQYEGFSFAIPANLARKVLEDLREFGAVKRGWLGVVIRPVDNTIARSAGLDEIAGVRIEEVNPGSAAASAGLSPGDVVTHIDGMKVTSSPDFMAKVGQHRPGDELKVDFIRNKKKQQARVRLSESRGLVSQDVATAPAGEVLADIGMTVRDLSTAEAGRLPKGGVIVESIRDNSRVAKTNMERNFIITEVNGVRIKTAKELRHEISRARTGLYLEGYYERFPGDFAYTLDLN